ncbi:unnamed protein product [Sphagnum jensenii]|uniref:Phytanoyl-CoA dioxygenase n=1 Tax=Sphagnum jensenii TaxID=128206 RepID=A0ABP0V8N5_9BRYO
MKPIVKDPASEKKLIDDGYIVVPFLSQEETADLKNFYYQFNSDKLEGMSATAHLPDIDRRMEMNNFIKKVFERAIAQTFINATALGGSFIAKGKGKNGTLTPHQDWNIVDELQFRSFNIWVPLVDLNENNGAICIMPGSHTWIQSYRSSNIGSAYHNVEPQLWERMTRLDMRAGEALIYDHRLIHASGENKTDKIRLAAVFGIIPDEASMLYYHKMDDKTVEIYESNKEFFLYENIFEGPKKLKRVGQVPYDFPSITVQQLDRFEKGPEIGLLGRLRAMLKLA